MHYEPHTQESVGHLISARSQFVLHYIFNHQIRHKTTSEKGSQPGDFKYDHFQSSTEICVDMYGLKHSFYHPPKPVPVNKLSAQCVFVKYSSHLYRDL